VATNVSQSRSGGRYFYRVSFSSPSVSIFRVRASTNNIFGLEILNRTVAGPGNYIGTFVATDTVTYMNIVGLGAGVGDYFEVGYLEVSELPGNHATQDTTAAKPIYRTDGTLQWLEFDGDDDALVANIPGITNATVAIAKSTGTEITYPVDLSSGTFTMNETNYGVIIREGEFTEQETLDVTEYLNAKAGIS